MAHTGSRVSSIKKAQKESLFYKEVSDLIMRLRFEDSRLMPLVVSRVSLSPDKKNLTIYLRTEVIDQAVFKDALQALILYKPSLRTALAKRIEARLTPELIFRYDKNFEKQRRIEELLEKIGHEDHEQ